MLSSHSLVYFQRDVVDNELGKVQRVYSCWFVSCTVAGRLVETCCFPFADWQARRGA